MKRSEREGYASVIEVNWPQGKREHTLIERIFLNEKCNKKEGNMFQERTDYKWHQDTAESHIWSSQLSKYTRLQEILYLFNFLWIYMHYPYL